MANLLDTEENSENVDLTSIFRIFTTAFALITVSTLAIQYWRQGHQPISEKWDDGIYLLAILAGAYLAVKIVFGHRSIKSHWALTVLALVGIILGIAGIDHPQYANQIWGGFGIWPLFLAIAMTPWIWKLIRFQDLHYFVKYLLGGIVVISSAFSLLSMYQGMNSVIDAQHSSYVINESLSVVTGHWPYVDFVPQYQIAYQFIIALFKSFLTTDQLVGLSLILMSVIAITTVIAGVLIVRLCLPNRSLIVATALVVPLTCVTPFPARIGFSGSIADLLSALPVRIFPGVIVLGIISWILGRSREKISISGSRMMYVGIFCGLVLWNSQDFGVALVVSIFTGILILKILSVFNTRFLLTRWAIGMLIGFLIYPLVSLAFGKTIHLQYYGFFFRQFAAGFNAEPIQTPGPVLLILPLIIAIFLCSIWILKQSKLASGIDQRNLRFAAMISLFFSIWSILGFCYYLNRSFASGQLQILLLPVAIALGGLVGAILQVEKLHLRGRSESSLFDSATFLEWKGLAFWPISLVASLALASVLLTPNPHIELQRLAGKTPPTIWSLSSLSESIKDANAGISYANSMAATIGYLGISSNYVQLKTGIESASFFNSPFDATISAQADKLFCRHLISLHLNYIVVGEAGMADRFPNQTFCGRYILTDVPGVRAGHFAKEIQ